HLCGSHTGRRRGSADHGSAPSEGDSMSTGTSLAMKRRETATAYRPSIGFLAAALVFLFWLVSASAGPWFVPHDPFAVAPQLMLEPPSAAHFFGTDELGRDV